MTDPHSPLLPDPTPMPGGERRNVADLVHQISHAITGFLGTGETASLRRLSPEDPANPVFFKIAAQFLEPQGLLPPQGPLRDLLERRWASILNGLALLGGLHRAGQPLGQALAEVGFSELRFVRLLRAREAGLWDAARGAARYLASKGQAVDWADMADLILSDGADWSESVRRRIARRYYSQQMNHQEGDPSK